jgi:hypothetical protein
MLPTPITPRAPTTPGTMNSREKAQKTQKKGARKFGRALVLPWKSNVSAPDTKTIYPFLCAFCAFLRLFRFEHPLARSIA